MAIFFVSMYVILSIDWRLEMKRLITCLFTFVVVLGFCTQSIYATSAGTDETNNNSFVGFDENGNLIQYDPEELEEELASSMVSTVMLAEETKDVTYGVVNFRTKASANEITTYTNCTNGEQGYINGYMMSDGAYLGMVNGKVKFKAAGVTGLVDASEVQIVDYANANTISCYKTSGGSLYHYVANLISQYSNYYSKTYVGNKPASLSDNATYYSYDGHYFYADFKTMIQDYKNVVYTNAVNSNAPYYNYFQYLPARTKTSITAAQFDQYTSSQVSIGKLLNAGASLISNQNKYGVNALMMYSNAVLESGWGQSQIAMDKNNLFGHGAADNNPYYGANGYSSVDDCIQYHAKVFISESYCDPKDYIGRYYGSHLGDKESGINVKYASDPYWGEKIASLCWEVQNGLGINEVNAYSIGMANGSVSYYTNPGSNLLFSSKNVGAYPIVLLAKQDGYYKVQSDATLNSNRTSVTQDNGAYDFDLYYAYISESAVTPLNSVKEESKWVQDENGNWYWYENNSYVTGWKLIQSKYYYFDSNGVMQSNKWIGNYYVGSDGAMVKNQWIDDRYVDSNGLYTPAKWIYNGKWWYRHSDGSYTKNDFEDIDGQTYYFDANGYMVTGWKKINNKDYFFNASGVMVKDAWQGAYYLGSDGAMLTNTFTKDGYYVGANGAYYTNRWFKDQGKDYYVNGSGKLVKNAWQGAYYLGKDGVMLTNAFTPDGYYVGSDGVYVRNQKITVDGTTYYLNADGKVAKNQWSGDYYLDGNGNVVKNKWIGNYWCGEDGKYVKNAWVDNNKSYVNENGIYVTNQWIGDYYVNGSGVKVTNTWVGSYWCGEDGKYVRSAWVDNNKSYVNENGVYLTNQWIGDYYVNGSGVKVTNTWVGSYWCGEDGKYVRSAWVDNNRYYVNENGVYVSGAWEKDSKGWKYHAGNVYAKDITLNINGTAYTFDSNGYMK